MRSARIVQTALLGLCAVIGLVATVAVAVDWLQGLDTWFWEESTCTIESSRAVKRPRYGDFDFEVSYRYRYRGDTHIGDAYRHGYHGSDGSSEARNLASRYAMGDDVRCWVDPDQPSASYLLRADLWQGFWILGPLLFVAVGVGSLWLIHGPVRHKGRLATAVGGATRRETRSGVGVGAMIVFFGIFFLFGAGFLIPFFIHPALQIVEARSWAELPCDIVSSRVRTHRGDDSATYSVDVLFRYEIDGREYESNRYQFLSGSSSGYERKAKIVEALPAGADTTCYVNPDEPFEAVIERGFTGDYLFGFVPLIFALIGVGGLVFAIGIMRRATQDAARPSWAMPTTPGSTPGIGWSPSGSEPASTSGPMVLEPRMGKLGRLGCAIVIALSWNGFISLFVWQIVQQWRSGSPEWFATIILTPFALIGLLLLFSIPHSILALLNPRPRVRLTPAVIQVGEAAQLEWAFKGLGSRIRRLEIWLEATETRTRVDGSSAQIETNALDTPHIQILDRGRELPLEYGAISFTVPFGTPPSSQGEPSIRWQLKLRGDIAYWPDVNEGYEVQVLPGGGSTA
jgi:hypothetical protein